MKTCQSCLKSYNSNKLKKCTCGGNLVLLSDPRPEFIKELVKDFPQYSSSQAELVESNTRELALPRCTTYGNRSKKIFKR